MACLPKLIYKFNTNSISILADLLVETDKKLTYIYMEVQRRTKAILNIKNKVGEHYPVSKLTIMLQSSRQCGTEGGIGILIKV